MFKIKAKKFKLGEHVSSIDEKDRKILRELSKNSRQSYRKIARSLGITTNTVINRANKMKEEGVILLDTVMISPEKVGFNLTALIEMKISKGRALETATTITKYHNVFAVYDITGEMDSVVLARFRDRNDLDRFVKNLQKLEFVERTNTHFVLNTVKEDLRVNV